MVCDWIHEMMNAEREGLVCELDAVTSVFGLIE